MTNPDLSSWYTLEEVKQKLQMSERSVYRLRDQKKIGWARRREKGKQPTPVYNPADVDAIQATLAPAPALIAPPPAESNGAVANTRPAKPATPGAQDWVKPFWEFIQRGIEAQNGQKNYSTLFLTIEEAAGYSGLSQRLLRKMCKQGAIPSIKDHAVKILRADLDALAFPRSQERV